MQRRVNPWQAQECFRPGDVRVLWGASAPAQHLPVLPCLKVDPVPAGIHWHVHTAKTLLKAACTPLEHLSVLPVSPLSPARKASLMQVQERMRRARPCSASTRQRSRRSLSMRISQLSSSSSSNLWCTELLLPHSRPLRPPSRLTSDSAQPTLRRSFWASHTLCMHEGACIIWNATPKWRPCGMLDACAGPCI